MKIIVIGCGLIGITSAYFLNRRGHEVTVIDRAQGPGRETSFANGALLTAGMAEPWNTPGCWRELLSSLGRSDAALQLRLRALPSLVGWGVTFLRNSRARAFECNASSNLRLALYSLETMESIRQQTRIEYGRTARGSLKVFRSEAALERVYSATERRRREGLQVQRLCPDQTIQLEPALGLIADELVGALHYASDEIGDAYQFCVALTDYLRLQGVEFRFNTNLTSFKSRSGTLTKIVSERECFVADHYVVAAGSYSTDLLSTAGVRLPVRPVKGYSLTFSRPAQSPMLNIPVIDDALHAAIVPLEGSLRVAGTAEFTGYETAINPDRIRNLLEFVQRVLPQAPIDPRTAKPWCGLRALSADGVPIIGPTPISNLWLNTGHGHLGWTMAAGSANLLVKLMFDLPSAISSAPYALERF